MAVKKEVKKTVSATKKVAVKKVEKKIKKEVEVVEAKIKVEKKKSAKYFYGVGRRKTSVAQIRLYENEKATEADLLINEREMKDYFPTSSQQNIMKAPLESVGVSGKFSMSALVKGGGMTGQVEAVQLGIARALVQFDESLKKTLRDGGFLTRDSRKVERKKPGLKKARRAPQWAKR